LARCLPMAAGWGGGLVVVAGVTPRQGGRESRPQGEGAQRVHACEALQGTEALVNTGEPWPDPFWAGQRVRRMQAKLHQWATDDPGRRFDDLFVRHEARCDRARVKDPRRWAVAAAR
jgi:hypothetical protein